MVDLQKILDARSRVYSQACQDGILQYIFEQIGTTNKHCVEFGFNATTIQGGSGANCARLILEDNWQGLFFDKDNASASINLVRASLTYENIGAIFSKYQVPQFIDYVSVDVDSIDLWLMKGILEAGWRPRVFSVEYNVNFPLELSLTCTKDTSWANDMVYGASLKALNCMAEEFNYILVAVEEGLDAFFVDRDIWNTQESLFEQCAQFTAQPAHPPTTLHRLELQMVEYPSMIPFNNALIIKYPQIFRIKK